jgi:predicted DNA binding protein
MFKAVLEVYHKGCWGSEINLKFPDVEFSSVDVRWVDSKVAHIVKATGSKRYFSDIIKYLKSQKDVKSIEILSRSDSDIYLRILTVNSTKHPSFSNMFFDNGCFPACPTRFSGKYEVWTLGSAKKDNIAKAYSTLKKRYLVNIKYMKEENIETDLMAKQREAYVYAKYFGYYSWPRKKSGTEIAKLLKISKTVFFSHLRRAENKILNSVNM